MSETITICSETDISQFAAIAVPTGSVLPFAGAVAPQSYLLCDGSEVSKETYAGLFAVIGDTYGQASEETVFKLPDMRGRVPVGAGQGDGLTDRILASSDGTEKHQMTISEMPSHSHDLITVDGRGSLYDYPVREDLQASIVNMANRITATGGDQPHNNMQPFLVVNYIIKV
ncbi:tail fiber protein [Thalassospira sp. GB04J01]|uniref:phage tail protein n=1 Tax=Thalassospira sp. GB04J01 TaxID=1485225 RepID=UPI001304AEF4|nr:tail fiber protein [Thalassospira sp. GB04J01]|tara:strand:+ start:142199 stop:142714 length:516 start_codon:yes stop_codon:yes gene_type:complete